MQMATAQCELMMDAKAKPLCASRPQATSAVTPPRMAHRHSCIPIQGKHYETEAMCFLEKRTQLLRQLPETAATDNFGQLAKRTFVWLLGPRDKRQLGKRCKSTSPAARPSRILLDSSRLSDSSDDAPCWLYHPGYAATLLLERGFSRRSTCTCTWGKSLHHIIGFGRTFDSK